MLCDLRAMVPVSLNRGTGVSKNVIWVARREACVILTGRGRIAKLIRGGGNSGWHYFGVEMPN